MGQIIALIRGGASNSGNDGANDILPPAAPVDFINPPISSGEAELTEKLTALNNNAKLTVLEAIKKYTGCENQIRNAISMPSPENEEVAWNALIPCVTILLGCYEYANEIQKAVPAILDTACSTPSGGAQAGLLANQATAKAFIIITSVAYEFDQIKISTPSIQNDFSYYRRSLSRKKNGRQSPSSPNGVTPDINIPISEEIANRMSIFLASPTPFLKLLIDGVVGYCKRYPGHPSTLVSSYLLQLATICLHFASAPDVENIEKPLPNDVALGGMTVLLILYDHVHPSGLFLRPVTVNLRAHVKAIQTIGGKRSSSFVNALKFSTKNYSSPEVPKNLKLLLDPVSSSATTN